MENKTINKPEKTRKDRRVLEPANEYLDKLLKKYLETRALESAEYADMVFNAYHGAWQKYANLFNKKKKGWTLDPMTFKDTVSGYLKVEPELAKTQEKINKRKQFERWVKLQKAYNRWAWLYNASEWVLEKIIPGEHKSVWKRRYEKFQKRTARNA